MKKRYIRYYLLTVIFIYSTVLFNINFISGYSSIGETSSVNVYSEKSSYELVSEGGYFTPCMNSEGIRFCTAQGTTYTSWIWLKMIFGSLLLQATAITPSII
jgi:hypothetical protein